MDLVLFISWLLRPQTALWIFFFFKHYWSVFTITPFRRKVKSHVNLILGQRSAAAVAPFLLAVLSIRSARRGCSASSENGKCRVCAGGLCAHSQNFKGRLKHSRYISKICFHTGFMYVMVSPELLIPKCQPHLSWASVVSSFLLTSKFIILKSKLYNLETYKAHNFTLSPFYLCCLLKNTLPYKVIDYFSFFMYSTCFHWT